MSEGSGEASAQTTVSPQPLLDWPSTDPSSPSPLSVPNEQPRRTSPSYVGQPLQTDSESRNDPLVSPEAAQQSRSSSLAPSGSCLLRRGITSYSLSTCAAGESPLQRAFVEEPSSTSSRSGTAATVRRPPPSLPDTSAPHPPSARPQTPSASSVGSSPPQQHLPRRASVLESLSKLLYHLVRLICHLCSYIVVMGLMRTASLFEKLAVGVYHGFNSVEDFIYDRILPLRLQRLISRLLWRPLFCVYFLNIGLLVLRFYWGRPLLSGSYSRFLDDSVYYFPTNGRSVGGGRAADGSSNSRGGPASRFHPHSAGRHYIFSFDDFIEDGGIYSMFLGLVGVIATLAFNLLPLILPFIVTAFLRRHHHQAPR